VLQKQAPLLLHDALRVAARTSGSKANAGSIVSAAVIAIASGARIWKKEVAFAKFYLRVVGSVAAHERQSAYARHEEASMPDGVPPSRVPGSTPNPEQLLEMRHDEEVLAALWTELRREVASDAVCMAVLDDSDGRFVDVDEQAERINHPKEEVLRARRHLRRVCDRIISKRRRPPARGEEQSP
jgi:hypothetical protein